ncbi:MAG TPA: hypothetical protein VL100_01620 [Croceibacterium sp.]|nr:hypothetical protein [Croceibacterium sp.]
MRPIVRLIVTSSAALTLQGCLAKTVVDVATMPVKAAGQAADWATTSQDEADRNRGRELRQREERFGKLERDYARQYDKCQDGDAKACAQAQATWDEMQTLKDTLPPPPGTPRPRRGASDR